VSSCQKLQSLVVSVIGYKKVPFQLRNEASKVLEAGPDSYRDESSNFEISLSEISG